MTLLQVLFAAAAALWGFVIFRRISPAVACLGVVLIGAVLGHPFFNHSVGPIPLTIDRAIWLFLIAHFAILVFLQRADLRPVNRSDLIVLALVGLLTISTMFHDWQYKDNRALSRLLFFNLLPIGMYFVAKNTKLRSADLISAFGLLAVFGIYLSITAIADQRGWGSLVFPKYILAPENFEFLGRARGPFLNPVSCGIFLVTSLAAALLLWPHLGKLGRSALAILASLFGVAIFLTLTRSVWAGAALGAFCLAWIPATRVTRGALLSLGTVLLVLGIFGFGDRINSFKRDKHVTVEEMAQSASLRPMLARVAWKMFLDRPAFGHGFGQYSKVKAPYHYSETAQLPLREVMPYMQHNVFLSYLTETGAAGLLLLLAFLATTGLTAWRVWRTQSLPLTHRQMGLLALVVVGNYCANGMFHDVSIIPHIGSLLFVTAGLLQNVATQPPGHTGLQSMDLEDYPTLRRAA